VAAAIGDEVSLNPSMDVLDFGCGTGLLTLGLQSFVHSITGVDSSYGMLEVLRAKIERLKLTNVRACHMDVEKGDRLEGRYHLIVSSMTLHHIRQIEPLLHQLHRVIIPDGYLCIADLAPEEGRFHSDNQGVFHFGFDRAALRQEFISAGFNDIRDRTAATMTKPDADGAVRSFTICLTTGRRNR
jgi:ubiquinone/menaquinone biosynthesis C-methylase UbiE